MDALEDLNQNFPCDRRAGYGSKGCSCNGTKTEDTSKVKCLFFGTNVAFSKCRDCHHQKQYKRMLDNQKKDV